ncbi:MAG: hypothetical protein FJX25_06650 [Alphaproteobacteria bacterium]|nr:hypothetical protein [Alphaproteobacteria bacterium]
MTAPHTRPVAAILDGDDQVVGTGCLVFRRSILTCAHVVNAAVGEEDPYAVTRPDGPVTVNLPFLNRTGLKARVVVWYPMRPMADLVRDPVADIAVLELEEVDGIEGGLQREAVDRRLPARGQPFLAYGFPNNFPNGAEASGEAVVEDPGGWLHVRDTQAYGRFIEPGFSGAPVFSREGPSPPSRLIGMASMADPDTGTRLAFILPSHLLCRAWPLLARPYRGLFAFTEEDADLFFGRRAFVAELQAKLDQHPFAAVVGPSGSGKSSVVLAGLVPKMQRDEWQVAICRPQRDPLRELALGLVSLLGLPPAAHKEKSEQADKWTDRLRADPGSIRDIVREAGGAGGRALLVIDQFEELFTNDAEAPDGALARPGETTLEHGSPRQAQLLQVLEAIAAQDPDTAVIRAVATLRADFMGQALKIGSLVRLLRDTDVKLGPMMAADLAEAVRKPAEVFGVGFEDGLAEELVAAMQGRPGGLPLLQFALERLWAEQKDRRLTWGAYRGPDGQGGLERTLNDHAEAVLERLKRHRDFGADAEERLRRIMLRLVRLGEEASGTPDARAVARRSEIRPEDWPLVPKLADERSRLLTIGRDPTTGEETVEVVHEALITAWGRLRSWLEEDRAFGLWRQRLQPDLRLWESHPAETLLRGRQLAEARNWLASHNAQLTDRERTFIEKSQEARQREADEKQREAEEKRREAEERLQESSRRNWLLASIVAALLLVIGIGIYFFNEAQTATKSAEAATTEAERLARSEHQARRRAEQAAKAEGEARAEAETAARLAQEAAEAEAEARKLAETATIEAERLTDLEHQARRRAEQAAAAEGEARADAEAATRLAQEAAAAEAEARKLAETAAREAKGRQLGAEAFATLRDLPGASAAERAAALAVEGWRRHPGSAAYAAATELLTTLPSIRVAHEDAVNSLAISADGSLLATGSKNGTARLIRTVDGSEIARIEHDDWVGAVAFSADGNLLAIGSNDGTARLIRTADGGEIARIDHDAAVSTVAISIDGSLFATGSWDNTARLIRTADGSESARINHDGPVNTVAISDDGSLLTTGSDDGTARLISTADGSEIARIDHDAAVSTVAINIDGSLLATGSWDNTARVIRMADGSEIARIAHDGPVNTVAISADGSLLATGSDDGTARLTRTADGSEITRVNHDNWVNTVSISADGRLLVTGSDDGTARLIRTEDGSQIARINHDGPVHIVAISMDGKLLATGSDDGTARLIRTGDGSKITRIAHDNAVHTVAVSADGSLLATGGWDNTSRLIRTTDGSEIARIAHGGPVRTVAFNAVGSLLATGSRDNTARLISTTDGSEIARIAHDGSVHTVAFSADGSLLVTGSDNGTARLIRTKDRSEIARVEPSVNTVAFSGNGRLLATGSDDGTAQLIRTADGSTIARIAHDDAVHTVAFSADGSLLATRAWDNTARLIRTTDGSEIARIAHDGSVHTVVFSADGNLLATGSADGTARLIRMRDGSEIARIAHGGAITSLAFSPDDSLLATGGADGIARLTRTADGLEAARVEHGDRIWSVAFRSDGSLLTIVLTNNEETMRLWLTPEQAMKKLCAERAGRNLSIDEWVRHIGLIETWAPTCREWRTEDPELLAAWEERSAADALGTASVSSVEARVRDIIEALSDLGEVFNVLLAARQKLRED